MDVKKCKDLSVTVLYKLEEADTLAKSEMAVTDSDCPAVSGLRDVRKVVRRQDEPLGGPTKIPARPDCRQEIPAPIVDLVTGKCKPVSRKVSRTVSASPLTIDMTVVCTPVPDPVQPGVVAHELPPTKTVKTSMTDTPFVATPTIVGGERIPRPVRFFRIATVIWIVVLVFLVFLTYVAMGHGGRLVSLRFRQTVCGRVSLRTLRARAVFNVSLSLEVAVQHTRENGTAQPEGLLLPTIYMTSMIRFWGDPISYARIEQLSGSESPLSLPVHAWPPQPAFMMDPVIQTVLPPPPPPEVRDASSGDQMSCTPCYGGKGQDGRIPGCPYRFLESGELPFTDGNPAYGLQLHHPRFLELVGAPESAQLLDRGPSYWVEELGKEGAMVAAATLQWDAGVMLSNLQILSQFAMALNRMSFSMMALGLE